MGIDWNRHIASVIDMGSESYESRMRRVMFQGFLLLLFIVVLWRFLK